MYRVLNSHCEVHVSIDDRVLARIVKNKAIKLSYGIAYRTICGLAKLNLVKIDEWEFDL